MKKSRVVLMVVIIVLLVLLVGFGSLLGFITDYLWFKELGYTSVFFKQLFTQLKIGIPTFLILTVLGYLYLHVLKKGYFKRITTTEPSISAKALNGISLGVAAIFGFAVTMMTVTRLWFEILKFSNSTDFAISDPIFDMDISFYVFKLQFITELNQILISVIIGFVVMTFIYYFLLISLCRPKIFEAKKPPTGDEFSEEQSDFGAGESSQSSSPFGGAFDKIGEMFGAKPGGAQQNNAFRQAKPKQQFSDSNFKELLHIASNQIIILGVIFFLMVGVNFFLRQYDLLYSERSILYGAGFTDINVTLWMYRAMVVLSVLAAIFFAIGIKRKKYRTVLTVPVIMIIIGALGVGASMLVQNLVVSPDEINKESEYLAYNIEFTQKAYNLDNVQIKPFAADNALTKEDIQNNMETISNIRINDYAPAKQFYNQTQSIRQYYMFNDVDVDRYMVNGEYTQTFLSARELDATKISSEWINEHFKYTHGYGITLSRVDKITASGQPDMLIKNIPPVSNVEEIEITRPEIYFGELTDNYIMVNTKEEEFDYNDGTNQTYTTYEGDAGIKMNLFNRVLFSIREQSMKLLVSSNIDGDSKIIINRNIAKRVQKIMPYLSYDSDPYIVTADGKLYWMIDAYTTSSYYPYSRPFQTTTDTNYIRNSVKVVIDAYNGDVDYYVIEEDPVALTYMSIYPNLFKSYDQMPEELVKHIRYPNDMLTIQADVYRRYHMTDVRVFYQSEDLWDIAQEVLGTKDTTMTPNYYIMKLPGEENVEFINSIPYTPRDKKNMLGLLIARNDGEHYGELVLHQLPKNKTIYGPMQIEAQITQHPTISQDFKLWEGRYSRGNMFVIPIEQSLVYVEPVYLQAENSSLPEVKKVIVAYGDRIAYQDTLAQSLNVLFGDGAGDSLGGDPGASEGEAGGETGEGSDNGTGTDAPSTDQLIQMANDAFTNATAAQKNGDWATYGQELAKLEAYLQQLMPSNQTQDVDANSQSDTTDEDKAKEE